jgi:hypothetical protein
VGEARAKADRVRRDSERELAAVSARRDSITAQLSNVRQMLATLGGGAALAAVEEAAPAEPEPVVAAADDDVVDEAAVEDEAVEEEQN